MATFVVTGTGRCGTAHAWRALRGLGVPTTHETFFRADRRSLPPADAAEYAADTSNDVSLYAAPFLREAGVPSLHLVRDPIATVNSLLHLRLPLACSHELCEFIRHFVTPEGDTDEAQWADYWVKWNQLCAAQATLTVRVEALTSGDVDREAIESLLGVPGFVDRWRELGVTPNRLHKVDAMRVPGHLHARLRGAGEAYGY
jgi:hypothetical protein